MELRSERMILTLAQSWHRPTGPLAGARGSVRGIRYGFLANMLAYAKALGRY